MGGLGGPNSSSEAARVLFMAGISPAFFTGVSGGLTIFFYVGGKEIETTVTLAPTRKTVSYFNASRVESDEPKCAKRVLVHSHAGSPAAATTSEKDAELTLTYSEPSYERPTLEAIIDS